eukprot:4929172-Alexandrium_andersonii.AAC.1
MRREKQAEKAAEDLAKKEKEANKAGAAKAATAVAAARKSLQSDSTVARSALSLAWPGCTPSR